MRFLKRAKPRWLDSTIGQILLILLGTLFVTHMTLTLLEVWLRPDAPAFLRSPGSDALQVATLIEAMRAVPPDQRASIAQALTIPGLVARLGGPARGCGPGMDAAHEAHVFGRVLFALLPPDRRVAVLPCRHGPERVRLDIVAHDIGAAFDLDVPIRKTWAGLPRRWARLLAWAVSLFLLLSALGVWAISRIIGPLQRLSHAVDRFGEQVAVAPLAEEGPVEIRRAARSINEMQARIGAALEDRTRMLAAISHDLRTPITRMRLRAELEPESDQRARTLRDLDLMQGMVSAALGFLREGAPTEPVEKVDLVALLESLCDEAAASGQAVQFAAEAEACVRCRPIAMTRAATNLIENACRYGGAARVRLLRAAEGGTLIEVEDNGPGIPRSERARALRPFVRLDAARTMGQGFGLGLTIVDAILRAHGGRLTLLDAPGGGLLARMWLPPDRPDDGLSVP